MLRLKLFISLILTLLLVGCGRVQPVMNIEDTPVVYDLQSNQVKSAIIKSVQNRGWTIVKSTSDELIAKITVRSHSAEVKIPYSSKFYSIIYLNSVNLKAGDGNIHRNYNRWVNNLNVDIQHSLSLLGSES